jgi:hypothetical protein
VECTGAPPRSPRPLPSRCGSGDHAHGTSRRPAHRRPSGGRTPETVQDPPLSPDPSDPPTPQGANRTNRRRHEFLDSRAKPLDRASECAPGSRALASVARCPGQLSCCP